MEENEEYYNNEEEEEEFGSSVGNLMDSRTSHLDDLLSEKFEQAFHKGTARVIVHDIAKIVSEHDPIDLARVVTRLPWSERPVVYDNLPDIQAKMTFMISTGHTTRTAVFRYIDNEEICDLVKDMPADEAVSVLDDLSGRRVRRIMESLDPKKAARIRDLQQHDRYSAGRLMSNEFFAFHMNITIGHVASHIRDNPGVEMTRHVFVLDDDGELAGYVPLRTLIVNPDDVSLRQVMQQVVHTVGPEATRDEVVDIVERYKVATLPVVNDDNILLGVLAYEDVVEMMEDIADETIASMAGTAEEVGEHEHVFRRFLWRAPWLVVTLCAGLTTATAMTHFKDRLWFSFVPFFVPLITGMSGNVGIQSSTILVRSMSTGELSKGSKKETVFKEVILGFVTGSIFGLVCGGVVYALGFFGVQAVGVDAIAVATIVCAGVFGACLWATVLGTVSPLFFARLRIDPAVASGPIVTAFNDVLSTLMYFFIAWLLTASIFG